ncbi:MAG: RNA 2',3'-cyclic phosphodiesterase [candidate division WOR-3 bacterium]
MRMFIGLDLPLEAKNYIYSKIEDMIKVLDLKWVDYHLYHITLKFLGEITDKEIDKIDRKLYEISNRYRVFSLRLKNLGKFPVYGDELNVLWIGVESNEELENLAKDIQRSFKNYGDNKPFSPHITIARNKKLKAINFKPIEFNFEFQIEKITLFESILYPSGPVYKVFKTYALKL